MMVGRRNTGQEHQHQHQQGPKMSNDSEYYDDGDNNNDDERSIQKGHELQELQPPATTTSIVAAPPTASSLNEFSRTVPPIRILKQHHNTNIVSIRIEADGNERDRLARRFELSEIAHLSADLHLMRHGSGIGRGGIGGGGGNNSNLKMMMIQVEGTCYAKVKQCCVRTNEEFDVALEFPLLCVVRPVVPLLALQQQQQEQLSSRRQRPRPDGSDSNNNNKENKKTRKKERAMPNYKAGKMFDEMAMIELERLLSDDEIDDDILMEDEAIYPVNGLLDVGELVAQMVCLSLDPYPKRPGTEPVTFTMTI